MLGVDHDGAVRAGAVGAGRAPAGWCCVPYLEGERTPNRPDATGALHGLTRANADPANLARAAVEGMLCGLADGLDAAGAAGAPVRRVAADRRRRPVGGGAPDRAGGLRRAGRWCPTAGEYVADGAARQAAWVLSGGEAPPDWDADRDPAVRVRARSRGPRALRGGARRLIQAG